MVPGIIEPDNRVSVLISVSVCFISVRVCSYFSVSGTGVP